MKNFKTKEEDLVYADEEIKIYENFSGELGYFATGTALKLFAIGLELLKTYKNGGFKYVDDYKFVINDICKDLKKTYDK